MPRIAPRTEPYDNPSRQQRHYKAKRDQVLNILARASHVSRCNFALLFVNARGQPDVYSSKLFASKLDKWFNEAVLTEAVETARNHVLQQAAQVKESDIIPEDDIDDDPLSFINAASFSRSQPGASPQDTEDADANAEAFPAHAQHFLSPTGVSDAYYNDVFQRMQQNAAKIIAKCWIKIIEPKKQSRHPYREAEESRPSWWPVGIRHKEPDHLLAKERQGLLVGILRAGVIPIKELEKKTFETIRDLSEDRLAMLRELFIVAREDERRRAAAHKFAEGLYTSPSNSQINGGGSNLERQSSEPSLSGMSDRSPLGSFMVGPESFQATPPPPSGGFDFPMQDLSATNKLLETPPAPNWTGHSGEALDLSNPFGSLGGAGAGLGARRGTAPELQTQFNFASGPPMPHLNVPLQMSPQRATGSSPLHTPIDQRRAASIAEVSPGATSGAGQGFPPQARMKHQAHQPRAASRSYHTSHDPSDARRTILGDVPLDPLTLAAMTARASPRTQHPPVRTPSAMRRSNRPGLLQLPERPNPSAVATPDPNLLSATSAGTPGGGFVFTPDTCTPMTAQLGPDGGYFDLPSTGWAGSPLVYRQSSQGVIPMAHFNASLMSFDSNPGTPLDINQAGPMGGRGSYFMPNLAAPPPTAQPQTMDPTNAMLHQDMQQPSMPGAFILDHPPQMSFNGSNFTDGHSVPSSRSASAEAQQMQHLNASYADMAILQPPAEIHSSDSDSRGMSSDGENPSSQFF